MLLSEDPLELHCQLSWLLSSEAHVAFSDRLQPRATCLPLAQQQALILSAAYLLSQEQQGHGATSEPDEVSSIPHPTRAELLQLLELLAGNSSCSAAVSTVHQTARMALHLQQAPFPTGVRHVCSRLQGAAPLPAWLPGSALHCFSWLAPQAAVADPDITTTSTASAVAADTGCANNQGVAALTHEEDRGASGTNTAGVEHMEADSPTTKRAKFTVSAGRQGATDHIEAPASAALPAAAAVCAVATTLDATAVQQVVQQLQELNSTCDARHVDTQLLRGTLTAAAAAQQQTAHADFLLHLQHQLQQLSTDALQPLIDVLLPLQPLGSTGSTGGSTVVSESALAYLLATAVLPRLQKLDSAAPQTLLASLVTVAQSQLDVLVSVVLRPLVCSISLAPVQVQLFSKLMKNVPQLPLRVLQLLVTAATVGQTAAASAAGQQAAFTSIVMPPGAGCCCCWIDSHAVLMRALADHHLEIVTDQLESVITAISVAARQPALTKSKSFGQLLLAVVKTYAGVMTKQQVERLQGATAVTNTFMTKTISLKLQQLAAQHAAAAEPMQQRVSLE